MLLSSNWPPASAYPDGEEVVAFVATYQAAREADTAAAFGADLRLAPTGDRPTPLPPLGPAVAATSPIRYVPVRAGTDRAIVRAAVDRQTAAESVSFGINRPVRLGA